MRNLVLAAALSLSLAGCGSVSIDGKIAGAEVALTGAENAALLYTRLPRCDGATPLCSNQPTVDAIKAADDTAYDALVEARNNTGTVDAALAAIETLSALIPQPAPAPQAHAALQGS